MSYSKEYIALKNFLHNACGVSRKELRQLVKECVGQMVADAIHRHLQTNEFTELIRPMVQRAFDDRLFELKFFVASRLLEDWEVDVRRRQKGGGGEGG